MGDKIKPREISHIPNEELNARASLPREKWISKDPNMSMKEWFEIMINERKKEQNHNE